VKRAVLIIAIVCMAWLLGCQDSLYEKHPHHPKNNEQANKILVVNGLGSGDIIYTIEHIKAVKTLGTNTATIAEEVCLNYVDGKYLAEVPCKEAN
jgi:hypothetical protein